MAKLASLTLSLATIFLPLTALAFPPPDDLPYLQYMGLDSHCGATPKAEFFDTRIGETVYYARDKIREDVVKEIMKYPDSGARQNTLNGLKEAQLDFEGTGSDASCHMSSLRYAAQILG